MQTSAERVQRALEEGGFPCRVVELPGSTRTAREAAEAIACDIDQIVKSLVFREKHSGGAILVLVSGSNQADETLLSGCVGEEVERATADFVREHTGFAIGGVPPIGHMRPLRTFIDRDLLRHNSIWAAAGTPYAVFELTPSDLQAMSRGEIVAIARL